MANSFQYTPAITEREYRGISIGDLVSKYFNNSYSYMASQFVEEEKIDIGELKELIARIEKERPLSSDSTV